MNQPPDTLRCKVAFWRDPHFYSALAAFVVPEIIIPMIPHGWQALSWKVYGALVASGIIAARRRSDTDLGLSSGVSSTQPGDKP